MSLHSKSDYSKTDRIYFEDPVEERYPKNINRCEGLEQKGFPSSSTSCLYVSCTSIRAMTASNLKMWVPPQTLHKAPPALRKRLPNLVTLKKGASLSKPDFADYWLGCHIKRPQMVFNGFH